MAARGAAGGGPPTGLAALLHNIGLKGNHRPTCPAAEPESSIRHDVMKAMPALMSGWLSWEMIHFISETALDHNVGRPGSGNEPIVETPDPIVNRAAGVTGQTGRP
jgi:hypothetical protein